MPTPFEGLRSAAGDLIATAADLGRTRLELAAIELEEERLRLARQALLVLLALLLLGVGAVFAVVFLVLLVDPRWRPHVVGGAAALFLIAGGLVWRQWQHEARDKPPLLQDTLAELERDLQALGRRP